MLALGLATPAQAQITVVESVESYNTTNTATGNANITVAAGNAIIVGINWEFQNRSISAVNDGGVNTYVAAGSELDDSGSFGGMTWYYVCSAASSDSLTISVTLDNIVDRMGIHVYELSGVASTSCYDKQSSGSNASGANNQTVTSFTPTNNNSIILAMHSATGFNQTITGQAGTIGQTEFVSGAGWSATMTSQYLVQTTATATTMSLTSSNGGGSGWGELAVVFKAAGGTSTQQQQLLMLGIGG